MEQPLQRDLSILAKHYFALSPSLPSQIPSPPWPTAEQLCTFEAQQWLVDLLLHREGEVEDADGSHSWRRLFWRRIVKGVEEGFSTRQRKGEAIDDEEVHAEILETITSFYANRSGGNGGPPPSLIKEYFWGDLSDVKSWKSVRLKEDGRLISGGTTGLRTWKASIALANHLLASPKTEMLGYSSILELGAGTGLLSLIVAQHLMDANPLQIQLSATDVDSQVLEQLSSNVVLNNLESAIKVESLDWGLATSPEGRQELSKAYHGDGQTSCLILAADVVYDPSLASLLAATLALLLNSTSQALIAGTIRNPSTWARFLECLGEHKLRVSDVPLLKPRCDGLVGDEGWEGEGDVKLLRIEAAL